MQAILYSRRRQKTSGKSVYLKGVSYAGAAALIAAANVANAMDTELAPAILPGFYEIRANGDAVFLMENGQPLDFDLAAAREYLKQRAAGKYLLDDTVLITVKVGDGVGSGKAWGCDLSYDYVKINAEYTT